jgi:carboxyl-terminal processing protease
MSHLVRRFSVLSLVVLAASALLGGLLADRVKADPQQPDDQVFAFGQTLALVEDHFVGEADTKTIVEDAISGMLATLDPHSNYLDSDAFTEMRDEQRGRFHGLGIQITKRGPDTPLTIIAPIDDTPAFRAGLQSGDIISHIEGQPTIDLTVHEAVHRLKGDRGTQVTITIERPGAPQAFDVTIERDEIPIDSVRVKYMLAPGVGFLRISNFTSTTAEELDAGIAALREQGMDRLLLDLRGNPGGLLDQAVQVAERFIPADELVVYTRGRIPGSNQDYVAKQGVKRFDLPLIVLVDRSSASASEIVSGAIQDHDRGLVVGEATFGKGLVQRVIPLRDGGALAVTTAKYYTPSGRLIQRDYSDLEEYYLTRADGDPEVLEELKLPAHDDAREVHYTASGRKVYGGGGIMPDHVVKPERAPQELFALLRENHLFNFAVLYANSHPDLQRDFHVDQATFDAFRDHLRERKFDVPASAFQEHGDLIRLRLRAQIARVKWGQIEEARILAEADPQIRRALELFPEAAELARRGPFVPATRS